MITYLRLCITEQGQGLCLCLTGEKTAIAQIRFMQYNGYELGKTEEMLDGKGLVLLPPDGADYVTACLCGQDVQTIFHLHFGEMPFVSRVSMTQKQTENGWELTVHAEEFARCVFLDCPDSANVHFSDNYFDLEKGQTRTVLATGAAGQSFTVKTAADIWEE